MISTLKARDLPDELWIMVLRNLKTFRDLTNAFQGRGRFTLITDGPIMLIDLYEIRTK